MVSGKRTGKRLTIVLWAAPLLTGLAVLGILMFRPPGNSLSQAPGTLANSATAASVATAMEGKEAIMATEEAWWINPPTALSCAACEQPGNLFPGPTATSWFPDPHRQAGDGMIIESRQAPLSKSAFKAENMWREVKGDIQILVFVGATGSDPSQGAVMLAPVGPGQRGGFFNTPTKHGSVRIVGAAGEVLELEAEDGTTFYFDVPSRSFVENGTPVTTPEPVETMDAPQ